MSNILGTKKNIIYILMIIFSLNFLFPQQNPLFKSNNKKIEKSSEHSNKKVQKNRIIWRKFSIFMTKIHKKLNSQFKELENNFNFIHLLMLLSIAIIYGFFHAAGPGHGKSLIVSYFIGSNSGVIDGIKISFIIGSLHTAMGLLLAIFFSSILKGLKGALKLKIQNYLGLLSGIIIIAIGLFLLIKHIIYTRKDKNNSNLDKQKNIYCIALAAGIVPCPMTLAIAMFAFSMQCYFIGIIAIIGISIGISLFLLLISIISLKAINISFSKLIYNKKFSNHIRIGLQYVSFCLIIFIGLLLIFSIFGLDPLIK